MSHSQKVELGYLSFAKGLHTEISPLMTQEELQGTTSDELNMDVDTTGMVRVRRRGFELPSQGAVTYIPVGTLIESRYWRDKDVYIVCSLQDSSTEGSYEVTVTFLEPDRTVPIDPPLKTEFKFTVLKDEYVKPSIAFLRTKCLLTFGTRPIVFTKEIGSGKFSVDYIDIYVRDFKLLNDSQTVTSRPTALTDEHKYNLYNAGWYQNRRLKGTGTVGDPVTKFYTDRSEYPSNADVAYLGDVTDSNGDVHFDPAAYNNVTVGSSEAPRGHYIYNIRDIDRDPRLVHKNRDGSPVSTLTPLVEDGKKPGTTDPIDTTIPVDTFNPETTPGWEIP